MSNSELIDPIALSFLACRLKAYNKIIFPLCFIQHEGYGSWQRYSKLVKVPYYLLDQVHVPLSAIKYIPKLCSDLLIQRYILLSWTLDWGKLISVEIKKKKKKKRVLLNKKKLLRRQIWDNLSLIMKSRCQKGHINRVVTHFG